MYVKGAERIKEGVLVVAFFSFLLLQNENAHIR